MLSGGKDAKYFSPRIASRIQKCTQFSKIPFLIFNAFKVRFYRSIDLSCLHMYKEEIGTMHRQEPSILRSNGVNAIVTNRVKTGQLMTILEPHDIYSLL